MTLATASIQNKFFTIKNKSPLSGNVHEKCWCIVELSYKESFVNVKIVVQVEEYNKMIKTHFSIKSTH